MTDEGYLYLTQTSITWEKLANIDGNTEYADSYFVDTKLGRNHRTKFVDLRIFSRLLC